MSYVVRHSVKTTFMLFVREGFQVQLDTRSDIKFVSMSIDLLVIHVGIAQNTVWRSDRK